MHKKIWPRTSAESRPILVRVVRGAGLMEKRKTAGDLKQGQGVGARCSLQKFCDSVSEIDSDTHIFSKRTSAPRSVKCSQ